MPYPKFWEVIVLINLSSLWRQLLLTELKYSISQLKYNKNNITTLQYELLV